MIPEIDDDTLERRASSISPVFRFVEHEGKLAKVDMNDEAYNAAALYYVKTPADLRNTGVNRQPVVPTRPAEDLAELARIQTRHTQSSMLNASVAEVLAQIPEEYLDRTAAFEVTHDFPCAVVNEDLRGFHITETILYTRRA